MFDTLISLYDKVVLPFWQLYLIVFIMAYFSSWTKKTWNFGINIILGMFGAWKTYSIFMQWLALKLKWDSFVISNAPFYFTDLLFNSTEDLNMVFEYLVKYMSDTNNKEMIQTGKFRNIVFIIDEGHLYFFSRMFQKNFMKNNLIVITQCRKRNILINFVTQELAQLDSTFRKLVPYVRKYYNWLLGFSFYRDYYLKKDDTDIKNEDTADIVGRGWFLRPWSRIWNIRSKFTKIYKEYFSETWVSKYIVWLQKNEDSSDILGGYTYEKFISDLYAWNWLEYLLIPKNVKINKFSKMLLWIQNVFSKNRRNTLKKD